MKEITVVSWDDLHMSEDGSKVEASQTLTLELDGSRVELDLTDDHAQELRLSVQRWLKAGNKDDVAPGFAPGPGQARSKQGQAYYQGLRDFAAIRPGLGLREISKADGSRSYFYPVRLRRAYAQHLQEQGDI